MSKIHIGLIPFIGFGIEIEKQDNQLLLCVDFPFFFIAYGFGKPNKTFRFYNEIKTRLQKRS